MAIVSQLGVSLSVSAALLASAPQIYSEAQGKEWVEECVVHYPEIQWLADSSVRKTEEGEAALAGSYSEQLFGQKYIEFDRTVMTLHCLRLFINGSDEAYETFTEGQPADIRLSKENFQKIHLEGKRLLTSEWEGLSDCEMKVALEAALILGDMGKSEQVRELFMPYGVSAPDHDDFYAAAIQVLRAHPDLSPTFKNLPSSAQKLLVKVAHLAHYGHITHLEGGVQMFTPLIESGVPQEDPVALAFDLFVHTCDVAGALGHVNNSSSIVYNELTHRAMQAMNDAVKLLSTPGKSEWDAYYFYLETRASWLGLDANDPYESVLARVGAMLRLFTPEEGAILKDAMDSLDPEIREKIAQKLSTQMREDFVRTPTYMPAVLVNLMNNPQMGSTKEERIKSAIIWGLPCIAAILEEHEILVEKGVIDPTIPLNFNKIAGIAKGEPEDLKGQCSIDMEGNATLSKG